MNSTVKVSIYGTTYTLQSNGNDTRIQEIASLVDKRMTELARKSSISSPANLAILVALNFANELKDATENYLNNETDLQDLENLITKVKQAYVQL